MYNVTILIHAYLMSGMTNPTELDSKREMHHAGMMMEIMFTKKSVEMRGLEDELKSEPSIHKALLEEMTVYFGKTYDCDDTELSEESVGTLMDLVEVSSIDLAHTFVDMIFGEGE